MSNFSDAKRVYKIFREHNESPLESIIQAYKVVKYAKEITELGDFEEFAFIDENGRYLCPDCDGEGVVLLDDILDIERDADNNVEVFGNDITDVLFHSTDEMVSSTDIFVICHFCDGYGDFKL